MHTRIRSIGVVGYINLTFEVIKGHLWNIFNKTYFSAKSFFLTPPTHFRPFILSHKLHKIFSLKTYQDDQDELVCILKYVTITNLTQLCIILFIYRYKVEFQLLHLPYIPYRAIAYMNAVCHFRSNLMLPHDRAHQDEDFELSYVKFSPEIKKNDG